MGRELAFCLRTMLTGDSEPTEYMAIEDTYSPIIHRINQGIRRRAGQPNEPVAPPADILVKFSNPPSELVSQSVTQLNNLINAADVKKGKVPFLLAKKDLT